MNFDEALNDLKDDHGMFLKQSDIDRICNVLSSLRHKLMSMQDRIETLEKQSESNSTTLALVRKIESKLLELEYLQNDIAQVKLHVQAVAEDRSNVWNQLGAMKGQWVDIWAKLEKLEKDQKIQILSHPEPVREPGGGLAIFKIYLEEHEIFTIADVGEVTELDVTTLRTTWIPKALLRGWIKELDKVEKRRRYQSLLYTKKDTAVYNTEPMEVINE